MKNSLICKKILLFILIIAILVSNISMFSLSSNAANNTINVSSAVTEVDSNNRFKVVVSFSNNSGIMGYKMLFSYDSTAVTPISVAQGKDFTAGQLTDNIGVKTGQFNVLWNSLSDFTGNGVAFEITFEKLADKNSEIVVGYSQEDTFNEDWDDVNLNCHNIQLNLGSVEAATVKLVSSVGEVGSDNCFDVAFSLSDNTGLMGFKFIFKYNASIIRPVSVTRGSALTVGQLTDNIGVKNGEFNVLWNNLTNFAGNGQVFIIRFEKLANATTELTLSYSQEDTFDENWDDVLMDVSNISLKLNSQETPTTPTMSFQVGEVNQNNQFEVAANLSGNTGIMGYKIIFSYDSSVLRPIEVIPGTDINVGQITDTVGVRAGQFNVLWNNLTEVSTNGNAFTLRFELLKNVATRIGVSYSQEDTFDGNWNDVLLNTSDIALNFEDSVVNSIIFAGKLAEDDSVVHIQSSDFNQTTCTASFPVNIKNNSGLKSFELELVYKPLEYLLWNVDSITPGDVIADNGDITYSVSHDRLTVCWSSDSAIKNDGVLFDVNLTVDTFTYFTSGDYPMTLSYNKTASLNESMLPVQLICKEANVIYTNETLDLIPKLRMTVMDNGIQLTYSPIKVKLTVSDYVGTFDGVLLQGMLDGSIYPTDFEPAANVQATMIDEEELQLHFSSESKEEMELGTFTYISEVAGDSIVCLMAEGGNNPTGLAFISNLSIFHIQENDATKVVLLKPHFVETVDDKVILKVNFADNPGIMGYKITVNYNPEVLRPISVQTGSDFGGQIMDTIGIKQGSFNVLWNNLTEVSEEGEAFNVTFKKLRNANSLIDFSFSQEDTFNGNFENVFISYNSLWMPISKTMNVDGDFSVLDDGDILANGKFIWRDDDNKVLCEENYHTNSYYCSRAVETLTTQITLKPKNRISLTIKNIKVQNDEIRLTGLLTDLKSKDYFNYSTWAIGDINDDDVVDITDISELLKVDIYGARNAQKDLNGDKIIDIADVSVILSAMNYGRSGVAIDSSALV